MAKFYSQSTIVTLFQPRDPYRVHKGSGAPFVRLEWSLKEGCVRCSSLLKRIRSVRWKSVNFWRRYTSLILPPSFPFLITFSFLLFPFFLFLLFLLLFVSMDADIITNASEASGEWPKSIIRKRVTLLRGRRRGTNDELAYTSYSKISFDWLREARKGSTGKSPP